VEACLAENPTDRPSFKQIGDEMKNL